MEAVVFKISDEERAEKYDTVARTWTARPTLLPCWRGTSRLWYANRDAPAIDDNDSVVTQPEVDPISDMGTSYQNQMYCRYWNTFINPSGHTCDLCKAQVWPELERWQVHVFPALLEKTEGDKEEAKTKMMEQLEREVGSGRMEPTLAAEIEFAFQTYEPS